MLIIEVILQIKKILYTRSLTSSFKKFTFQWFLNIFLTIFRTRILIRVKSTENQPRRNGKRWWNTLVVKFATLYRRRKKSLSPEIRTRRNDKRRIKKQREQSVGKALKGIKEGWWEGGWEWRMTERNKVQRRGFFSLYRQPRSIHRFSKISWKIIYSKCIVIPRLKTSSRMRWTLEVMEKENEWTEKKEEGNKVKEE